MYVCVECGVCEIANSSTAPENKCEGEQYNTLSHLQKKFVFCCAFEILQFWRHNHRERMAT